MFHPFVSHKVVDKMPQHYAQGFAHHRVNRPLGRRPMTGLRRLHATEDSTVMKIEPIEDDNTSEIKRARRLFPDSDDERTPSCT